MNKRTRRATFLSVLVLVVGGVGFAAAQTDEDVEPSTADAAPTQTTPAETAPSEAPSEPAAPPSVAPGSSEQSDSAHHKGRCGARLDTASEYLGIERQELRDRLASGESLASIADATEGKTAAGLREALLTDLTRQVEETDGLTEAQKFQDRWSWERDVHQDLVDEIWSLRTDWKVTSIGLSRAKDLESEGIALARAPSRR